MSLRYAFPFLAVVAALSSCGGTAFDESSVGTLGDLVADTEDQTSGAALTFPDRPSVSSQRVDVDAARAAVAAPEVPDRLADTDGDGLPGVSAPEDSDGNGVVDVIFVDKDSDGATDSAYWPVDDALHEIKFVDESVFLAAPPHRWTVSVDPENGSSTISADTNDDGISDTTVTDSDGDGIFDSIDKDLDNDGFAEFQCLNHDLDASCEETWVDDDGDGRYDENTFDGDLDGTPEDQDLEVHVPVWTIVSCDDLDGDEAEDVCHLDWDGDGVADSSEEMVVYWPDPPVDLDNDGLPDPSVSFKVAPYLIEPPAGF